MIDILGIPMYDQPLKTAVDEILSHCLAPADGRTNRCVSATDAHGLVHARQNISFRNVLNQFSLILPDGMPSVWIGRWKGAKNMERCYGPDLFAALMSASADRPIRHYLAGGKEGVAEALRKACGRKFHNHHIVGTYTPPFRPLTAAELKGLADDINGRAADIVWVGLSTPKQEAFALALSHCTQVHFLITVGAAFDFHTGRVAQAPRWIQRAGLEWLFRLCREPRRLFRRYVQVIPCFIYYTLKEWANGQTGR